MHNTERETDRQRHGERQTKTKGNNKNITNADRETKGQIKTTDFQRPWQSNTHTHTDRQRRWSPSRWGCPHCWPSASSPPPPPPPPLSYAPLRRSSSSRCCCCCCWCWCCCWQLSLPELALTHLAKNKEAILEWLRTTRTISMDYKQTNKQTKQVADGYLCIFQPDVSQQSGLEIKPSAKTTIVLSRWLLDMSMIPKKMKQFRNWVLADGSLMFQWYQKPNLSASTALSRWIHTLQRYWINKSNLESKTKAI